MGLCAASTWQATLLEFSAVDLLMEALISDIIDIPPPPRGLKAAPKSLHKAQVVVHLVDGRNLRGALKLLSYARLNLLLEASDGPMLISFTDLLYLAFVEPLELSLTPQSYEKVALSTKSPPQAQSFKIVLKNNHIVGGKMKSAFIDGGGIHVFKLFDAQRIIRLFFPAASVVSSQLGEMLGEALVASKSATPALVDKALLTQKKQREKKLGDYLIDAGIVRAEQLDQALQLQQKELGSLPAGVEGRKLGELLVADGIVKPEQLEHVLQLQQQSRQRKIGEYIVEMGVTPSDTVQVELARKVGLPFVRLNTFQAEKSAINLVPREVAQKFQLMPLKIEQGKLVVAVDDPFNKEAIDTLQFVSNLHVELVVSPTDDISKAISKYYDEATLDKDIVAAENLQQVFNLDVQQEQELLQMEQPNSGAPMVRLVAKLIVDAIQKNASDIHIRPKKDNVDLLFRLDGTLVKMRSFNKALLNQIISRIKIIGKMDIAERRLPQDGSAQVNHEGNRVDLRISIIPTVEGESAVIRLLNSQVGLKSISDLGFNKQDAEEFADMMHKSNGLVLVTGPTGSGKSTTLYAALKEVIARNLNIITVENPVEYHIEGIEQIEVNTVPGYTFARALRHILRHDPDVIMIGEIRDEETGKIAVESALTGHLVLSTLHTNDAAGAITRLLEMGVDPFLLSGTLLGIFAQRLVRRNCEKCIDKENVSEILRKALKVPDSEPFWKGRGCEACRGTGYKGRIAAYELLRFSPEMRGLLQAGVTTQTIHTQAVIDGMTPLTENALALARSKITSAEEVYRVRLE